MATGVMEESAIQDDDSTSTIDIVGVVEGAITGVAIVTTKSPDILIAHHSETNREAVWTIVSPTDGVGQ